MTLRIRQALLLSALVLPLVAAAMTAPPFVADTRAQGPTRMLGPNFPVRVDANGDGVPGSGDESIVPARSGSTVTIPSRWACTASSKNQITLSNPSTGGQFQTVSRTNGALTQSATVGGFVGGAPTQFSYSQAGSTDGAKSGTAGLTDVTGNGIPDLLMIAGSVSVSVSFAYAGNSDHISVPWAQASALGVDPSNPCGGTHPQIWIPLADTNGDGAGDTIVFDLDGNGIPDADLFRSPTLGAPSVPTMGAWVRSILLALMAGIAAWFLSRRQPERLAQA